MTEQPFFILYVDSPEQSAAFYQKLLNRPPLEASPTFAMFPLHENAMLGLWSKHTVRPATTFTGESSELAFAVKDRQTVNTLYQQWKQTGLPIIQEPTEMSFGLSFMAQDPDGHRLRILGNDQP